MELIIWLVDKNRERLIGNQRKVNSFGSMKAVCMLSVEALGKALEKGNDDSRFLTPSLIVLDYDTATENGCAAVNMIKERERLSGVPMFFSADRHDAGTDEYSYSLGVLVVVNSCFTDADIYRIERMAWQHENTRDYEHEILKQLFEIRNAREISRLNELLESRNKLLRKVFERYFSDDVVELILNLGAEASLGGEKTDAVIMMSDLRNFTTLSEDLDAGKVTDLLNYYFGKMVDIIIRYSGTVIEFIGDGMLIVFGAPIKSADAADNAVAAAIAMQNAMPGINAYCLKKGFPQLEMGIGLHYGEVFIGNIGSERFMRYNVIGNTVNECSRIESCTVGGQILVSKAIQGHVKNPLMTVNEAEINVKGIKHPITIFDVMGIGGSYGAVLHESLTDTDLELSANADILLRIFPVRGKLIERDYFKVKLISLSNKKMVVEPSGGSCYFEMYASARIEPETGVETEDKPCVYGKVTGRSGDGWILNFTDTREATEGFIEQLISYEG